MKTFAVLLLISTCSLAQAQPTSAKTSQTSSGNCSPNIISQGSGPVTVRITGSCSVADGRLIDGLNKLLAQFPKLSADARAISDLSEVLRKTDGAFAERVRQFEALVNKYEESAAKTDTATDRLGIQLRDLSLGQSEISGYGISLAAPDMKQPTQTKVDPKVTAEIDALKQRAAACNSANSQKEAFRQYQPDRPLTLEDCSLFEAELARLQWGSRAASYLGTTSASPVMIDIDLREVSIHLSGGPFLDTPLDELTTAPTCMRAWPSHNDITGAEKLSNGIAGLANVFQEPAWTPSLNQPSISDSGFVVMTFSEGNTLTERLHSRDTDFVSMAITECGVQRFASQQWNIQVSNWHVNKFVPRTSFSKDYHLVLRNSERADWAGAGYGLAPPCWRHEYVY